MHILETQFSKNKMHAVSQEEEEKTVMLDASHFPHALLAGT